MAFYQSLQPAALLPPHVQAMHVEYPPPVLYPQKPDPEDLSDERDVPEEITPEKSMDLTNDPRFMAPNIIEKRLFAFNGPVTLISGLLTSTSLNYCIQLKKDLHFGFCEQTPLGEILRSAVQLCAFFTMFCIVFMSLFSTLVCVYQAYFTYRLMTAGTNGFELAKRFYLHPLMTNRRHRAVALLGWGLVLLLVAAGGMMYVKFGREAFTEYKKNPLRTHNWLCSSFLPVLNPIGSIAFALFTAGSLYLHYNIQRPHKRLFDILYAQRNAEDLKWHIHLSTEPLLSLHSRGQPRVASPPPGIGCAVS